MAAFNTRNHFIDTSIRLQKGNKQTNTQIVINFEYANIVKFAAMSSNRQIRSFKRSTLAYLLCIFLSPLNKFQSNMRHIYKWNAISFHFKCDFFFVSNEIDRLKSYTWMLMYCRLFCLFGPPKNSHIHTQKIATNIFKLKDRKKPCMEGNAVIEQKKSYNLNKTKQRMIFHQYYLVS